MVKDLQTCFWLVLSNSIFKIFIDAKKYAWFMMPKYDIMPYLTCATIILSSKVTMEFAKTNVYIQIHHFMPQRNAFMK